MIDDSIVDSPKSHMLSITVGLVVSALLFVSGVTLAQDKGPRFAPIGIQHAGARAEAIQQPVTKPDSVSSRFSSRKAAFVGALIGGLLGGYVVISRGDYSSCANDIGPFFCRIGELAFVLGGAAIGALVGYLVAIG